MSTIGIGRIALALLTIIPKSYFVGDFHCFK